MPFPGILSPLLWKNKDWPMAFPENSDFTFITCWTLSQMTFVKIPNFSVGTQMRGGSSAARRLCCGTPGRTRLSHGIRSVSVSASPDPSVTVTPTAEAGPGGSLLLVAEDAGPCLCTALSGMLVEPWGTETAPPSGEKATGSRRLPRTQGSSPATRPGHAGASVSARPRGPAGLGDAAPGAGMPTLLLSACPRPGLHSRRSRRLSDPAYSSSFRPTRGSQMHLL